MKASMLCELRAGSAMADLASLDDSLRETLHKEAAESERRQKAAEIQKLVWEQLRSATPPQPLRSGIADGEEKNPISGSAVELVHAKEKEIEKRKLQVREKVQAQLSRVEHEARNLDQLRKELESMEDPTKKEVADIRKKIESVDRDLRPMKQLCERKEKELKEALEAHNEKSKVKSELVGRLMEIVTESERVRMQKLEELTKLWMQTIGSVLELDKRTTRTSLAEHHWLIYKLHVRLKEATRAYILSVVQLTDQQTNV